MNPNKWKWYTYVTLAVIALQIFLVFIAIAGGLPVPWSGLLISASAIWLVLRLLHEIVRAFYLAITDNMPPPIDRPH